MSIEQVYRHLPRILFPIVSNQSYLIQKTYQSILLEIESSKQLIYWKISHSLRIAAKVLFASVWYSWVQGILIKLTNTAWLLKITQGCYIWIGRWLKWTFGEVCPGLNNNVLAGSKDARTSAYTSSIGSGVNVASWVFGLRYNQIIWNYF
jgi:hypothetical protein